MMQRTAILLAISAILAGAERPPIDLRVELATLDDAPTFSGTVRGPGGSVSLGDSTAADSAGRFAIYGLGAIRPAGSQVLALVGGGFASHGWEWDYDDGDETFGVVALELHGGLGLDINSHLRIEALGTVGAGRAVDEVRTADVAIDADGTALTYGLKAGGTVHFSRVVLGLHGGFMGASANLTGDGTILGAPVTTTYSVRSFGPTLALSIGLRL